jgi:cytochrome c oxidase assembly protein subunit 15
MSVQPLNGEPARDWSDVLAIGFGTTVAMWAVGYVGHMPLTDVSPAVFISLMLGCVLAGGWVVGRKTQRGVRGGIGVGLIVALLNLLILGSALVAPNPGQVVPRAGAWVPGYFAFCIALSVIGAAIGAVFRSPRQATSTWDVDFAWVACAATLLLISIGGLVTGFRAGMAVPDWPNTYGSNMFLYPLGKMTGGVFYEHAHRLMGSLVGLTTFTLAVLLTIQRRSISAVVLVWIVGIGVAVQGVMGGLRVTQNNINLAVIHGFFAHIVLAGMVGVAALLTRLNPATKGTDPLLPGQKSGQSPSTTDCFLATLLVVGVILQTLLGAFVRQKGDTMKNALLEHISVAMFVILLAIVVGVRLWGLYPHVRLFARGGVALIAVVVLQLMLGGVSLAVRTPPAAASPSAEQLQSPDMLQPAVHAIITTLHQTTAAVLLGLATYLAVSCWRLLDSRAAAEDSSALSGADVTDPECLAARPLQSRL